VIIGVDPHKGSHAATALNPATNTAAASLRIEATLAGYRQLLRWGKAFPERQWAIENAHGLGQHLAQWLVARGETVVDVRTTATALVRELSRGGRRKNDVLDVSAAASVAAAHGDAWLVAPEDETTVFALLEERRANLAAQRVRLVNQLQALLRDLVPGGAHPALTAQAATALLRGLRPVSTAERCRKDLARELVREIRAVDARLVQIAGHMAEALCARGTRLLQVQGIGPVLAVRLIGRTGHASRFPAPQRSQATPASLPWRSPAAIGSATDSLAAATDSLTARFTWSRSPRCACRSAWALLLRPQGRGGQDPQRGDALPEAAHLKLAADAA
jgi:transposase